MSFEKAQQNQNRSIFASLFSKAIASTVVGLALTASPMTSWSQDDTAAVKMSKSGICHDASSRHYARLKNFKAYGSIQACLDDGGRAPKK